MITGNFNKLPTEPLSHNECIKKYVLLKNGRCGNITQLARAVFPPGQGCQAHSHSDMAEIFMVRSGALTITIDSQTMILEKEDCIVVEPNESHALANTGSEDLVLDYFGLAL